MDEITIERGVGPPLVGRTTKHTAIYEALAELDVGDVAVIPENTHTSAKGALASMASQFGKRENRKYVTRAHDGISRVYRIE